MITKYLLERAIDMLPIASDDVTRFHLCGVYIVSAGGKVTLTATDGYMLLTREYSDQKCPEGKFMLKKEHLPALKSLLKEFKHTEEFDVDADLCSGLSIGPKGFARGFIPVMEGQYPDYMQVIPKPYADQVAITLNAEYILALAKALTDGEKRAKPTVRIVFDPSDSCKPALIQREGKDGFTAVCMPIHDGGTAEIASKHAATNEWERAAVNAAMEGAK